MEREERKEVKKELKCFVYIYHLHVKNVIIMYNEYLLIKNKS